MFHHDLVSRVSSICHAGTDGSLMGVGLKGSRVSAPYLVDIYN